MANVDNLNFKVIIDDKQFNQKIKAMEDMAKKFNTSMSNLLNVQAVSQQLVVSNRKRLQMETDLVRATEMQNREKIKTEGLQRKINAQIERASKGYQSQSRILQELKGYALGYLSIHGASQLLSSLVRVTGEFELQKTTLAAMLGDLNQAESVITRIQGLAVESPFQFKELTTYAKQLSAFSVPAQELYDTTKMLADISAGLGVGMDRIVLAYGQVRSAAFLRGQEVRQFTEAGIPILDELAKQFSELEGRAVSTGEVFDKISARLVPFEMVAKVFKDMTSEGGKFYNMQEVQAETLRGKISNLKDAYEVMLNEIGKGQSEKLKGAVDWARRLMQNYEETGRTLVELVAAYGIYRTTLFLTSNHITTLTRAHAVLMKQMRNLTKLLIKNKYAALAVAAIGLINKLYKLGKEIKSQSAIFETLSKSQSEYAKNVAESTVALDALYAKINLAKKGTKDYNTALSTIQRTYAPYIEQLRSEGVEVDNLATLYGELTKKINESAQARFVESARKDLDQTYAQELSDILNGTGANARYNLKRLMESLNFNEAEGVVLRMFLSGSATWDEISEKYGELAEKVEGAYVSLGAGSSGPVKAKDYLDGLKNTIAYLTNEYTTAIAVVDEFAIKMKETPDPVVLATGWRKTVQDTLTGMGLNKGTSFGLWAEDTTQSTEYVDDMIKRYKELGEQIKNISSFDPDQTERLKKNKEAIEAIAKELGILDLLTEKQDSKREKTETDYRIRALKREAEVIKEAMETYEKWMDSGFFTDDVARELLGKIYGDTQAFKEGVTTYTEGMVDALKDSEALRLKVYQNKLKDKNGKEYLDVPTVGWGHTGKDVNKLGVGAVITKEQADQWLKEDLARLTGDLNDVLQDFGVSLNQAQYDALAHMVFNTGKGGIEDLFEKSMDELGKVDLDKVAENILTHRTNNGTKALVDRRLKEYEMFTNDVGVAVSEDGKLMTNFDEMLNRVILRLQALGEKGKEAAAVLQSAFDKSSRKEEANDVYESYEKQYKAVSKYYEMLRKWSSEDFNLNGEGIVLDVSKIASDLSKKMNEIDLRARKAKEVFGQIDVDSEEEVAKVKEIFVKEFGADAWEEFWKSYKEKGENATTDLANKQKEYEKKLAQERVNDLAQKYVKESYFEGNIDLTDLSDKNFFQLRELRKKLQNLLDQEPLQISVELTNDLAANGVDVSSLSNLNLDSVFKNMEGLGKPISEADQELLRLIQSIQKAGLSTEDFGKIIKKVIGGDLKNLTKEQAEELMAMVQSYMGEIKNLMTSIADFAETIGDEELQGAMNGITDSMEILGSVADKLAKGDWIGAIISGVTSLASKVMEAVSAEYALNDAIAETRNEMLLLNSQKRINAGVESIFGEDDYKKFQNAYDEVVKAHATAIKDLEKQNQTFWGRSKDNWGVGGVAGSLAAGAGLGAVIGSIFPVIGTAIGAGVGALIGMVVGLVGDAATTANDYAISLQQMADEIGAELIDAETGTFNIETLKSIKKTYSDLDKEYMQMIDKLIANAEVYENAVTEMATFMTDIFGQCADEMADAFINSFKESGQAALEYGDIMSNLATDIAKSIIKSTILQNVFSEEDARNAAISLAKGDAGGALAVVEDAMQAAQDLTPYIQEFLESLKPYFDMGDMESQNLGDGIKGITEDTAHLLASYFNAIRADVSYARTIWERMDATTQQIAAILVTFSVPNLMEYQAQIAANTYNTAMHTQSIMEDLRSMMTSEGGYTALRVYS